MSGPSPERAAAGTQPLRPTGHARVDAVLAGAAGIAGIPVAEHAARYEDVHAALLAELDDEPGAVPAGLVPGAGTATAPEGEAQGPPR